MGVIIRRYTDADGEGFRRVRSMAFRSGESIDPEDKLLRDDCIAYVGVDDGQIVAATTVLKMTASKQGLDLPCGGLAAVGVVPEKRRSGIGSKMMAEILPMMRDEGLLMASLYPFRATYYRKFGYEPCGKRYQITCPGHRLPKLEQELEIRQIEVNQKEQIAECYRQFSMRYAGMNKRDDDQWWRLLGGDTPLAVYVAGDPIEAYAVFRLNGDFWVSQQIKELVWNSARGYRSLLSFFRSLSLNKNDVEWREPGDSPYLERYEDQGAVISIWGNIMFRAIDVPKLLATKPVAGEGEFSFKVLDSFMPENVGPWSISFKDGSVQVDQCSEASFELSIGQFTQAFLGEPSLESMIRNGSVAVPEASRAAACAYFHAERTYCMDYF
jgi:predicted acetyltransferase